MISKVFCANKPSLPPAWIEISLKRLEMMILNKNHTNKSNQTVFGIVFLKCIIETPNHIMSTRSLPSAEYKPNPASYIIVRFINHKTSPLVTACMDQHTLQPDVLWWCNLQNLQLHSPRNEPEAVRMYGEGTGLIEND